MIKLTKFIVFVPDCPRGFRLEMFQMLAEVSVLSGTARLAAQMIWAKSGRTTRLENEDLNF